MLNPDENLSIINLSIIHLSMLRTDESYKPVRATNL